MSANKGQIWLSAVSYVLITIIIVVLLLNTGLPLLEKIKDKSIYSKTRDAFLNLNEQIKDVQAEGPGSQRVIPIEILKGEFEVQDNQIKWSMQSKAKIVEPRSKIIVGDLIIGDDSFITFQDTIKYLEEEFNSLSTSTWNLTDACAEMSTNGALQYSDAACSTATSTLKGHKNFSTVDGLTLEFSYHGGTTVSTPADEFYIGFGDSTVASSTAVASLVGGFVFNGSAGYIQTMEYDGAALQQRNCITYSGDTRYYGKITLNHTRPRYFVSTDQKTWIPCPNENSSKPSLLRAQIVAVSGTASFDDLTVHDNLYHINNSYLAVDFDKFSGTKESMQFINTSKLLRTVFSKLTNATVVGNFTFRINDVAASENGNGYVQLSELRTDPDAAVIISHVNTTNYEYDLIFTLEGGVDFVQINVQNLVIR